MGSNSANDISMEDGVERSEAPIEIKIKTLDSQTYTLRVNKQMPVPELKQQIASVTGVLSEQQRLICRGRVLKDDQLLSAYHIEDGHTLHLVVGQPGPPSVGNLPSHAAGTEPESNTSNGQRIQIAPGVVVETYDSTDPGHMDINRIVAAVLGAFGVNDIGSGERNSGGSERTTNTQPEQSVLSDQPGVSVRRGFGFPPSISLGSLQSRVIPDSLTTLSRYLDQMRQEYGVNVGTQRGESHSAPSSVPVQERLPTPEVLSEVLLSTRDFLMGQTAESLHQLGTQLHNQSSVTDPVERLGIQSSAWRIGTLLQNLGAFVLELGRATMTLRMGSPTEAVVNAGPAVFISQSGPNPLMVQPLPFQPGTPFGSLAPSTIQQGTALVTESGTAFVPRRIDIQIRRGSMMRENVNQEEPDGSQTHAPPLRTTTVIAAVPAHQLGRLPGLGRSQSASANLGDRRPSGPQQPTSESGVQQNTLNSLRGSSPTNAADELGQVPSRRFRFSVSSSSQENQHPPGREVPGEVYQVLRSLFPGGEIHVEDLALPGTTTAATPVTESTTTNTGGTSAQEQERTITADGIFLSNFLREIMPVISQHTGVTPDSSTQPPNEPSTQGTEAGTSRRPNDDHDVAPSSKRQKKE